MLWDGPLGQGGVDPPLTPDFPRVKGHRAHHRWHWLCDSLGVPFHFMVKFSHEGQMMFPPLPLGNAAPLICEARVGEKWKEGGRKGEGAGRAEPSCPGASGGPGALVRVGVLAVLQWCPFLTYSPALLAPSGRRRLAPGGGQWQPSGAPGAAVGTFVTLRPGSGDQGSIAILHRRRFCRDLARSGLSPLPSPTSRRRPWPLSPACGRGLQLTGLLVLLSVQQKEPSLSVTKQSGQSVPPGRLDHCPASSRGLRTSSGHPQPRFRSWLCLFLAVWP